MNRRGFSLMELVVTVMIIGILAAVGIPQYLRTIETSRADDAVAMVNMIGTTNKMFALDHSGVYTSGTFPTAANTGCGTSACPASGPYGACALVWCKYLADQNFGSKPYTYFACDGAVSAACNGIGSGNQLATADRESGAYSDWAYAMSVSGVITAYGTNVPPPTY